jgi:hypothetical protein
MIRIVPFDVNTSKLISGHVDLYPVKFLENIKEVVEVFDSNLINTKVINNETELDVTPFVVPETRGGFSFIVTFSKKQEARRRDQRRLLARMLAWGRP